MKELLQKITAHPLVESRWLNTLSLLEHTGARKIVKTVGEHHPSLQILCHTADETRHAYVFRRLSEDLAPHSEYLCADEALSYFQMLDTTLCEWVSDLTGRDDPYQNYLLVASAIERRAMQVYSLYKNSTRSEEVKKELGRILREEADHHPAMESAALKILAAHGVGDLSFCQDIEEKFFDVFLSTLKGYFLRAPSTAVLRSPLSNISETISHPPTN